MDRRRSIIWLGLLGLALYFIFFGKQTVDTVKEAVLSMFKPKYAGAMSPYDDLINLYAFQNGLDPLLVRAVIRQESNWDPGVPGSDGLSIGLMQITLPLAHDFFGRDSSFDELADPETNIKIGTWYLGREVAAYGQEGGIASYNEGPGNWLKGKHDASYVNSVLGYYKQYQDAIDITG